MQCFAAGSGDNKSANGTSHGHDSALGLMDNPMYEVSMQGTHLPLGKSPSVEVGVEYDVDNPLYMMGIEDSSLPADGVAPIQEYEYDDIAARRRTPPTVEPEGGVYAEPDSAPRRTPPTVPVEPEGGVYAEPDSAPRHTPPTVPVEPEGGVYAEPDLVLHSLPPPPPPPALSSSPPSHHYTEPDIHTTAGTAPQSRTSALSEPPSQPPQPPPSAQSQPPTVAPGPIYDAPLLLDKKTPPPSAEKNHYETADVVIEASQNIYDSENED